MVRVILDTYIEGSTEREIHIRYDRNIANDKLIMDKINQILLTEQPLCENCANYYLEGYFCGYRAHCCKIHGCLEGYDHPHRDNDGSKCPDYCAKDLNIKQQETFLHLKSEEEQKTHLAKYVAKLQELKEQRGERER